MAKSLFDHINAITKDKKKGYWESLDDGDKKTWSNFMVTRFLSMNSDWIEFISEVQPLIQELPPKQYYQVMSELIPLVKSRPTCTASCSGGTVSALAGTSSKQ